MKLCLLTFNVELTGSQLSNEERSGSGVVFIGMALKVSRPPGWPPTAARQLVTEKRCHLCGASLKDFNSDTKKSVLRVFWSD